MGASAHRGTGERAQLQQHDAQLIGAIHQVAPDALPAVMAAYKTGGTALTAMGQQALRAYGYQALPMALPTRGLLLALALAVALLGCALWGGSQWRLPGSCAGHPARERCAERARDAGSARQRRREISILQNEAGQDERGAVAPKRRRRRADAPCSGCALGHLAPDQGADHVGGDVKRPAALHARIARQAKGVFNAHAGPASGISWLVEALLKLSKLDAGSVQLHMQPVPIETLCAHALLPLADWIRRREVCVQQAEMEGLTLYCDAGWMAEALMNILKNCIEHTGPGKHVYISAQTNALYTQIQIRDEGGGIDKEDLPHLFERFYRGKNASPDSVGIGLAMSQRIVQEHRGVIDVRSTRGVGSEFTIRVFTHLQTRTQGQAAVQAK